MKLDITDIFTRSTSPFYGIILGKTAIPLVSVVLPVTFRTRENYRTKYIKFEVADFELSYHVILSRPALAKFVAIPHYLSSNKFVAASGKLTPTKFEIPEKTDTSNKPQPTKEEQVKAIDLGTGDNSKTTMIGAGLDYK
jgi:hypothetical protein